MPIPCLSASPERGISSPHQPTGIAIEIPVGISTRPPPAAIVAVLAGEQVEPGVAVMGVGRQRQLGVEPDEVDGQRHGGQAYADPRGAAR